MFAMYINAVLRGKCGGPFRVIDGGGNVLWQQHFLAAKCLHEDATHFAESKNGDTMRSSSFGHAFPSWLVEFRCSGVSLIVNCATGETTHEKCGGVVPMALGL